MQITQKQYEKIAKYLPKQRGNVSMSNLQLINAILYVTENGCKWRALPETYGNWHTIYVRMNRWSKNGVLSRVFAALQTEGIIQINAEAACSSPPLYSEKAAFCALFLTGRAPPHSSGGAFLMPAFCARPQNAINFPHWRDGNFYACYLFLERVTR